MTARFYDLFAIEIADECLRIEFQFRSATPDMSTTAAAGLLVSIRIEILFRERIHCNWTPGQP